MPLRTYKRQRVPSSGPPESADGSQAASAARSLAALPADVLTRIARLLAYGDTTSLTSPSPRSRLFPLAFTCKALGRVVLPVVGETLFLSSTKQIIEAAKLLKTKEGKKALQDVAAGTVGARQIRSLGIELANMYASPPALSTLRTSCTTLLSGCPTSLTSLSISLSPLGFPPIPFTVLFPSRSPASLKALISLTYLSSFTLSGATSVWLHDLVPLLAAWAPSLRALELALLRGDCTRPPPVEGERPRALRALRVRESTLPGEMVAWLLDGQTRLEELEMPLPGAEGPAWEAVGRVVSRVEVLKVWDRWGGAAGSGAWKGKAKAATNRVITLAKEVEVDELASDAGDDTEGDTAAALQPPSPLLDLVRRAPVLRTVFLPASLVPTPSSFASLLPHLARVSTLLIEDAPSTGLRKAVEAALVDEVAGLGGLEKVVSVVKKGKGDKQKAKAFAKRCAKKGVEWEVREAA